MRSRSLFRSFHTSRPRFPYTYYLGVRAVPSDDSYFSKAQTKIIIARPRPSSDLKSLNRLHNNSDGDDLDEIEEFAQALKEELKVQKKATDSLSHESALILRQEGLATKICFTALSFLRKEHNNLHFAYNNHQWKNILSGTGLAEKSLVMKDNERDRILSAVAFSRILHLNGLLLFISNSLDLNNPIQKMQESLNLLEKTSMGDDQFIDRVGVMNDLSFLKFLSTNNLDDLANSLKRNVYMARGGYKASQNLQNILALNQSEILFLKATDEKEVKMVQVLKTLKDLAQSMVKYQRDETFQKFAKKTLPAEMIKLTEKQKKFEMIEPRDAFGVDLSFMIYFNMAKAYLRMNSLPGVQLYLDAIYQKYFKVSATAKRDKISPISKMSQVMYLNLLGIYTLKNGISDESCMKLLSDAKGHFVHAKAIYERNYVFFDGPNLPLICILKNLNSIEQEIKRLQYQKENLSLNAMAKFQSRRKKSKLNSMQTLAKTISTLEYDQIKFIVKEDILVHSENNIFLTLYYPSGYFLGGTFDLAYQARINEEMFRTVKYPPIVWK